MRTRTQSWSTRVRDPFTTVATPARPPPPILNVYYVHEGPASTHIIHLYCNIVYSTHPLQSVARAAAATVIDIVKRYTSRAYSIAARTYYYTISLYYIRVGHAPNTPLVTLTPRERRMPQVHRDSNKARGTRCIFIYYDNSINIIRARNCYTTCHPGIIIIISRQSRKTPVPRLIPFDGARGLQYSIINIIITCRGFAYTGFEYYASTC